MLGTISGGELTSRVYHKITESSGAAYFMTYSIDRSKGDAAYVLFKIKDQESLIRLEEGHNFVYYNKTTFSIDVSLGGVSNFYMSIMWFGSPTVEQNDEFDSVFVITPDDIDVYLVSI